MSFLSETLVDTEYAKRLNDDLKNASVCRFLIAYVSTRGLNAIGRRELLRALDSADSYGVASLSCACGFHPLLELQQELGDSNVRLKYFMEPVVKGTDEPENMVLMHSKLVYLRIKEGGAEQSVVYLGSHNWTSRALGSGGPRNAEASYRFAFEFHDQHLQGQGTELPSQVNRHLHAAYEHAACLPATESSRASFDHWDDKVCKNRKSSELDEATVILATATSNASVLPWQSLKGQGIYLQCLEETEGNIVWNHGQRIVVLVWKSQADLRLGMQPVLLLCHETTHNAGPASSIGGTNQSINAIEGFRAVIHDASQLAARSENRPAEKSAVDIWSGSQIETFDFEFPTQHQRCSQVDGSVEPHYQFNLKVDDVVIPANSREAVRARSVDDAAMVWRRETLAFAKTTKDARYIRVEGYLVPDEQYRLMQGALEHTFRVSPNASKAFPISEEGFDYAKIGKRVPKHPLHQTFIPKWDDPHKAAHYGKAGPDVLVPDADTVGEVDQFDMFPNPVERVQQVFVAKLDQLRAIWTAEARKPSE